MENLEHCSPGTEVLSFISRKAWEISLHLFTPKYAHLISKSERMQTHEFFRQGQKIIHHRSILIQFAQVQIILLMPAGAALVMLTGAQYIVLPFFEDGCGNAPKFLTTMTCIFLFGKLGINL